MTPTPPSAPQGNEAPAQPAPEPGRRAGAVRRVVTGIRRHPGRALAVLVLLALIGVGVTLVGIQLWAAYHFRAAAAALARYHYEEAGEHLGACLLVWPNDPDVLFLAARAARRAGLHDQADAFLTRVQELRGRDDDLVLERALLSADRGDLDDVVRFCHAKVEADDPATPLILEAVARGGLRSYRLAEADWAVQTWLQREPNNSMAHHLAGRIAREKLADIDASAEFRRALAIDPALDSARDELTYLLLEMHQGREALPHLEYLTRRRPNDPVIAVRLAQCRDLLGDQDEAVRLLDGVLARYPNFQPALAERGKLALNAGQREEAEVWLRKAVALAPGDATLLPVLNACLLQQGKDEESRALEARLKQAREDLERIHQLLYTDIQKDPDNAELQYEVGMIFLRKGAVAEALRWLENAVRLNPRHAKANEALADLYERQGLGARAAKHRRLAHDDAADKPEKGSDTGAPGAVRRKGNTP
jgi:tetratricopeptide (TPR) repeat protein